MDYARNLVVGYNIYGVCGHIILFIEGLYCLSARNGPIPSQFISFMLH